MPTLSSSSDRWRAKRDPLFRGDGASAVTRPTPTGDSSVVRHILFLGGSGRETPYLSTTERRSVAEHFAGRHRGAVWKTNVNDWPGRAVKHFSRSDLSLMLRGKGKGLATWSSAWEVARARVLAEQWAEHLADFRAYSRQSSADLDLAVGTLFEQVSP